MKSYVHVYGHLFRNGQTSNMTTFLNSLKITNWNQNLQTQKNLRVQLQKNREVKFFSTSQNIAAQKKVQRFYLCNGFVTYKKVYNFDFVPIPLELSSSAGLSVSQVYAGSLLWSVRITTKH